MWDKMTEHEQRAWLHLAKAIWLAENEDALPSRTDAEAIEKAWQAAKSTEMRKALSVKRRLENKGIALVSKQDA